MGVVYVDASALTKLVVEEPESETLGAFVGDLKLLSSEVVRAEIPRALRRVASEDRSVTLDRILLRAEALLDAVTLAPIEGFLLEAAGELQEPRLRTIDAIHVMTATYLEPIDAFVTYDVRQAVSARLAGLRTLAPGA